MSIKSMTGYGKCSMEFNNKNITVEIRSLNSKQLDLSIRMPQLYKSNEMELRSSISAKLNRGKIDVSIHVEQSHSQARSSINIENFKYYYNQIEILSKEIGFATTDVGIISGILRMPEVIEVEEKELDEKEWKAVTKCVDEAVNAFNNFREEEGNALCKDILNNITEIELGLEKVEPFEGNRINTIKERLEQSLSNLNLESLDRNRFEQELIYYLEKFDVNEEKVRLKQHCTYFKEVAENEETPGRKLAFITQEIGREVNTLGSKANEVNIQRIVVEMKDRVEKVKEQLLNVL